MIMQTERILQSSHCTSAYGAKGVKHPEWKRSFSINCLFMLLALLVYSTPLFAQGPNFEWVKRMAGTNWDNGYAITLDSDGNSYTTGLFRGTADFDPGPDSFKLSAVGTSSNGLFVSKLDPAGNFVWAKSFCNAKFNYAYAIAHDASNNIYVTGYFYDILDFDPGLDTFNLSATGSSTSDVFILKLDSAGNLLWAKAIGGASNDQAFTIAVDSSDNVLVGGKFSGPVDFDPGTGVYTITPLNTGSNAFILKLNPEGQFIWAKDLGQVTRPFATSTVFALAVDGHSNVYTAGYFRDTIDFDPGVGTAKLVSKGEDDIFVSKLDAAGNFLWAKSMGSKRTDQGTAITLDAASNVYLTGTFSDTVDFDPGQGVFTIAANNTQDLGTVILKLSTNGDFIWAKDINGVTGSLYENNYAFSIKTDKANNSYITGYFNGWADFDPGTGSNYMYSFGASDVFILKLDASGNFVWSKQIGGPDIDVARSSALDPSGNVYTTGWFRGTSDFDPGTAAALMNSNANSADIFVVKLNCGDTSSLIITDSADCNGYTLNGVTYTATGTYTQRMPNIHGCDSTITLNLTIIPVLDMDINITIDVNKLSTTEHFATYQWLLNGQSILGATDSTYTVTSNGDYQVVVTNTDGCIDTSDVYSVTNVTGIRDVAALANQIKIYPSPTVDWVNILSPEALNATITGMEGRQLLQEKNVHRISIKSFPAGLYLLNLSDQNGTFIKAFKIIKQ
jgi:hypothetical protein